MQNCLFYIWCFHTITESLPISSSGHIRLLIKFLKKYNLCPNILSSEIDENIDFAMHITTFFILFLFLIISWWPLLTNLNSIAILVFYFLIIAVLIADLITGTIYLLFNKYFKQLSNFDSIGFLITSLALLLLIFLPTNHIHSDLDLVLFVPCVLGVVQGLALLPGISRMATTYAAGRWLGLDHEFSFLLSLTMQFPLVLIALLKVFVKNKFDISALSLNNKQKLILLLCSTLSLAILFVLKSNPNLFIVFGFYMFLPILISLKIR